MDVRDHAGAHRRRATVPAGAVKALAALALAAGWALAAILLLRTEVPEELTLPHLDPSAYFPAGALDRAERFRTVTRALWALTVALELAVVALVAWKARPLAARLRPLARGRIRTGLALASVALAGTWVATLPPAVARHWWNRRYDLSRQAWDAWLADRALGVGVRAALLALGVAGALWLAGRLGARWWLAGAPALVALAAAYVLAQPIVVQPLFNRLEPLPDRALAADVRDLGGRIGVEVETVQVADASRRTTAPNARVTGVGPTRRVVFDDTILDGRFGDAELRSVAAHELAHVARRHVPKGIAWFALLAVPGVALVALVTERRGGLRDPALVPLGLLVALAFSLLTLPVQNAVSRRYEAEADWIALRATGDPDAAIALDRRLALASLGDPDPPGWVRIALSTHPPSLRRIAMAEAYRVRAGSAP